MRLILRRAKRVAIEGVLVTLEMAKSLAAAPLHMEVSSMYVNIQYTRLFSSSLRSPIVPRYRFTDVGSSATPRVDNRNKEVMPTKRKSIPCRSSLLSTSADERSEERG